MRVRVSLSKIALSSCCAWNFLPQMTRSLEPFEHCLAVVARVRLLNAGEEEAAHFANKRLAELLHIDPFNSVNIAGQSFSNAQQNRGEVARVDHVDMDHVDTNEVVNPLSVSKIFSSQDGYAEFRFTLERNRPNQASPYKRVTDLMLRMQATREALVDVVEICTVPVTDASRPANDSNLLFWLSCRC